MMSLIHQDYKHGSLFLNPYIMTKDDIYFSLRDGINTATREMLETLAALKEAAKSSKEVEAAWLQLKATAEKLNAVALNNMLSAWDSAE
jgi:hypothetical protein